MPAVTRRECPIPHALPPFGLCQPLQSSEFPKHCSNPYHPPLQIARTCRGCSRPPAAKATSFAKHVSGRSLSGPVTHVSSTCVLCAAKPSASLLPLSLCSCCSLCLGLLTLNEHLLILQSPFQNLTLMKPHPTPSPPKLPVGLFLACPLLTLHCPHQSFFLFCTKVLEASLVSPPRDSGRELLRGRECVPCAVSQVGRRALSGGSGTVCDLKQGDRRGGGPGWAALLAGLGLLCCPAGAS